MPMSLTRRAATATFGGLVLLGTAALPAGARGGNPEVRAAGTCTARSTSKIKVKLDDGRIEAEFEVDSNRVGQRWTVHMRDNGVLVFDGSAVTQAPSGSFEVERRITNRAGSDRVTASATNAATGERCTATATL